MEIAVLHKRKGVLLGIDIKQIKQCMETDRMDATAGTVQGGIGMKRLTAWNNGHAYFPECFKEPCNGCGCAKENCDFLESVCRRLAEYEDTGTPEECRDAVERKKTKKPEYYGDCEDGKIICSSCGQDLWDLKDCGFNNCPYCGQAIDWSE